MCFPPFYTIIFYLFNNTNFQGGPDSDAGVYYCVAKNKFGEVRSQEANLRVAMLREEFRINPHSVQVF